MTRPLLTRGQVAERLNVSADWFYRRRRTLEAKGFPRSLPGFAQGRWCPVAIEAWIARHGRAPEPPAAEPQTGEMRQEELRQALQDRARQITGSGRRRERGSKRPKRPSQGDLQGGLAEAS